MERVRSFVEIPQLLISLPLARLDSTRPTRKMKRIVNLLACFAALAAAYAAALSRPGLLQGRERLMVALVRESEWKNWGREEKGERRKQTRFKKKRSNWVSSTSSERSLGDHPHPAFSPVHARLPDRQQHPPAKKKKIEQLPAIILLCFALYALATLLLGVAAFRDVPEANAGLQSDIAEARKDLARRGVVDVVASD